MRFLKDRLCDLIRATWNVLATLIGGILAVYILAALPKWTSYKIDARASIRKALSQVVVFRTQPDLRLSTQYPVAHGISSPKGWITSETPIHVSGSSHPLWLSIGNNEPITMKGVTLLIQPDQKLELDYDAMSGCRKAWLFQEFQNEPRVQYQYTTSLTILPDLTSALPCPPIFHFPAVDTYRFHYSILSEDWAAVEGTFTVVRDR
jgi:hypothetical protein